MKILNHIDREIRFLDQINEGVRNNKGKVVSYSMTEAKKIRTLEYLITGLPDRPTVDYLWSGFKDMFNHTLYGGNLKVFYTCDYETKDRHIAHIYSGPTKADSLRIDTTDNSIRISLTYKVYGNY